MNADASSYYPPRSQGWGRWRAFWALLRRGLLLPRLDLPTNPGRLCAGFVLPGYAFYLAGYTAFFAAVAGAYGVAGVIYLVALGFPPASWAFAAMMSLHVTSAAYMHRRLRPDSDLNERVCAAVAIFLLAGLAYAGAQNLFGMVFQPVRFNDRVFVVKRMSRLASLPTGEWICYSVAESSRYFNTGDRHGAYVVQGGYGVGKIWAWPGDQVAFATNSFSVNGVFRPRKPEMPVSGAFTVPRECCFAWPDFAITEAHGPAAEIWAQQMRLDLGLVSEKQLVGRIGRSWFWRKQL